MKYKMDLWKLKSWLFTHRGQQEKFHWEHSLTPYKLIPATFLVEEKESRETLTALVLKNSLKMTWIDIFFCHLK